MGGVLFLPVFGGLMELGDPQIGTCVWGCRGVGGQLRRSPDWHQHLGGSRLWVGHLVTRIWGSQGLGGRLGGPQVTVSTWGAQLGRAVCHPCFGGTWELGGSPDCHQHLGVSRIWGGLRLSPLFGGLKDVGAAWGVPRSLSALGGLRNLGGPPGCHQHLEGSQGHGGRSLLPVFGGLEDLGCPQIVISTWGGLRNLGVPRFSPLFGGLGDLGGGWGGPGDPWPGGPGRGLSAAPRGGHAAPYKSMVSLPGLRPPPTPGGSGPPPPGV